MDYYTNTPQNKIKSSKNQSRRGINKIKQVDNQFVCNEYLINPLHQLEKSCPYTDAEDWNNNPDFPDAVKDLLDFVYERLNNENADDLKYLTTKFHELQLSPAYKGATLTNIKFKKLWETQNYRSFEHFTITNFGIKRRQANLYIDACSITLILLRYGFKLNQIPQNISHFEPLQKYVRDESLLVAKWSEVLENYNIEDVSKEGIKLLLFPKENRRKYSTKLDVGSTLLCEEIKIIAKLERVKVSTLLKRLIHRAYSHIEHIIQRVIDESKKTVITNELLTVYQSEFRDLNSKFTPFFPNTE